MASEKFIVVDFRNRISKCLLLPEYDSPNMTLVERQSRGVLRSCVGRHGNLDTQCEVKWINRIHEAESGPRLRNTLKPDKVFSKKTKKHD